jgi:carbonic anhydrase
VPADTTVVGVVYDFQDVYTERRGAVHVVNVDGDTDPDALREANPEIADRIRRRWTY